MSSRYCQGGFCEIVLPNLNNGASVNDTKSPSKRETRLQRSRDRDRALRALKWVLTEEEYSSLEEAGDLVRLRATPLGNSNIDDGFWMDGESVNLAKREHRPDLARLAFAEFQSSGEGHCDLGDDEAPPVAAVDVRIHRAGDPNYVTEPSCACNDGDVVVCGVCFSVYTLLKQARDLLTSHPDISNCDETANIDPHEQSDNQTGNHPVCSLDGMEESTSNNRKRGSIEGSNIFQSDASDKLSSPTGSFRGPISPQYKRCSIAGSNPKSAGNPRVKKRDRKQMEQNSKIQILVAESDEVCAEPVIL